ncbi:MAG: PKD domain-containing protein, partial [Methanosarcinales archaeon]|nr:PKD domain-containing protein [Methanosarcinales archaeon]
MQVYKIKILILTALFVNFLNATAQNIKKDTTRHQANIKELTKGKSVVFSPELSQLRQVAGAPKAYWQNYWEFGDGQYSFEEKPKHKYKEKGEYTVRLSATNNYDDGKPPLTRPKKINTNDSASLDDDFINENHNLISKHNGFRVQNNREPSPNQEMQLIISYANDKNITTNGKLYLFFNDTKFKNKNFELLDIRSYHNEEEIDFDAVVLNSRIKSKDKFIRSTGIETFLNKSKILNDTIRQDLQKSLEEAKRDYYNYKIWNVNDIEKDEERNLFFTLKTTPEMLKDTSAVLTIRSIYVPERGNSTHKITEKEMEIVTSHDPNKMAVYNSRLNYRLVRFKRLKYKVRFQNNGEGPASLIKLNTDIPKMLDRSTLRVLDMYPKVPICPDNKEVSYSCLDTVFYDDKVSFQFKNIYLPGSNQKGVHEKDSTKGFVKYSMKFGKDFHKIKSKSRTAIIFDKNEPIITNSSTSRFKPGISIGAKAGYNYFF